MLKLPIFGIIESVNLRINRTSVLIAVFLVFIKIELSSFNSAFILLLVDSIEMFFKLAFILKICERRLDFNFFQRICEFSSIFALPVVGWAFGDVHSSISPSMNSFLVFW